MMPESPLCVHKRAYALCSMQGLAFFRRHLSGHCTPRVFIHASHTSTTNRNSHVVMHVYCDVDDHVPAWTLYEMLSGYEAA